MKINKHKAKALAEFDPQEIVQKTVELYAQKLDAKIRERREHAPAFLQWMFPVPQRRRIRARAEKEFWAFGGPGRRIQADANEVKRVQVLLQRNLEGAREGGVIELNDDHHQILEAGFAAIGGKYKDES